jgi:hypothetical protein
MLGDTVREEGGAYAKSADVRCFQPPKVVIPVLAKIRVT